MHRRDRGLRAGGLAAKPPKGTGQAHFPPRVGVWVGYQLLFLSRQQAQQGPRVGQLLPSAGGYQ